MKLYSLKCKSLKIYNIPFTAPDDGAAISLVANAVKQGQDASIVMNLEDLSLFTLGVFDSKEGVSKTRPKLVTDLISIPGLANLAKEVAENVQNAVQQA